MEVLLIIAIPVAFFAGRMASGPARPPSLERHSFYQRYMHELKGVLGHGLGFVEILGMKVSGEESLKADIRHEFDDLQSLFELMVCFEDLRMDRQFQVSAPRFFKLLACILREAFERKGFDFHFELKLAESGELRKLQAGELEDFLSLLRLEDSMAGSGELIVGAQKDRFQVQLAGFCGTPPLGFVAQDGKWKKSF